MTISNSTETHRIFPYPDSHHKDKPETYLNIRVASKVNRNDTKDIPVYFENGIRLKIKPNSFKDGAITKGYYSEKETNNINDRIKEIWDKAKAYLKKHPTATKQLIEEHLYGVEFLQTHKKRRTKELHLEILQILPSDLGKELRTQHPKRKENITVKRIDDEGYEVSDTKQIIIDPLDVNDPEFPKHFPKSLYERLQKEYYADKPNVVRDEKNIWFETQFIKFRAQMLLASYQPKETVVIDNEVIKQFESENGQLKKGKENGKIIIPYGGKAKLLDLKKQIEIDKLTPKQRYEKGLYDKSNIFEVAGQILFLNKSKTKPYSDNWKMAVMKLFDYRSRYSPKESINSFSIQWLTDFLEAIHKGYSTAYPRKFNPFDYDPAFFKKGSIAQYNDLSLQKFIKNVKEVFSYLTTEEHLPLVNIDKIKYEDYHLSNVMQDTEKDFYLTKIEIDKLFFFKFKATDNYSVEELNQARDLFICQFWFGGLRPKEELLVEGGITIMDDGYGSKKVNYIISKDSNEVNENPICTYSDEILKKYNYDFEKIKMPYEIYIKILKALGKQVFNREIIKYVQKKGVINKIKTNVNVEFTSYFARRSFEQILNFAGINQADTGAFTGRKMNLGSIKNYRHFTYEQKREKMEEIKPILN